jgi:hypothetical protein
LVALGWFCCGPDREGPGVGTVPLLIFVDDGELTEMVVQDRDAFQIGGLG